MSLKKLQEKAGIVPDGIFGPNTFKHCSKRLGITVHNNAVHFWAQVGHETGNFRHYSENLNYSSSALLNIFGKYFKTMEEASQYARNPEKIANKVYANRMGNGNEQSGDGWKYRGRGALQLTGKDNYQRFALSVFDPFIVDNPNAVEHEYSFESAIWFFDINNLWNITHKDITLTTIREVTRRINGGYNGLAHRIELTRKYSKYEL